MGKFNLNQGNVMNTTEIQESTETKLRRIAQLSKNDKSKEFGSLMHHFNEESLAECFHCLAGSKAVGVDSAWIKTSVFKNSQKFNEEYF